MRSLRMEPLHMKKPAQGGPETKKPPQRVASTVSICAGRARPPEFHTRFAEKSNRSLLVARIGKCINRMQAAIPLLHKTRIPHGTHQDRTLRLPVLQHNDRRPRCHHADPPLRDTARSSIRRDRRRHESTTVAAKPKPPTGGFSRIPPPADIALRPARFALHVYR